MKNWECGSEHSSANHNLKLSSKCLNFRWIHTFQLSKCYMMENLYIEFIHHSEYIFKCSLRLSRTIHAIRKDKAYQKQNKILVPVNMFLDFVFGGVSTNRRGAESIASPSNWGVPEREWLKSDLVGSEWIEWPQKGGGWWVGLSRQLDDAWMNDMLDLARVSRSSSLLRSHPRPIPFTCAIENLWYKWKVLLQFHDLDQ